MKASFKPRARLLKLLGDQLIGTPQLAIFELVKNSYDADADRVEIVIRNPGTPKDASIEITDFGGIGMDLDTVLNIWLEPGAGHKEQDRNNGTVTEKHKRLPLGEKGVGRFAVHKLGDKIKLITKSANNKEISLEMDWDLLDQHKYIEDLKIDIVENPKPVFFKDGQTGTRIVISKLKQSLNKPDVRKLYKNVQSITSNIDYKYYDKSLDSIITPIEIKIIVPEHPEWIEDLTNPKDLISEALFKFSFIIDENGKWSWTYKFKPTEKMRKYKIIEGRECSGTNENFKLDEKFKNIISFPTTGIGPIMGEVYAYDLGSDVTPFYSNEIGSLKGFLKENKGIKVYRDWMRVYNYGEPQDDWLDMDQRRIQNPSESLSRDIINGAITLDLKSSLSLVEKTNREGFIEDKPFETLKAIVISAIEVMEGYRRMDKSRLKDILDTKPKNSLHEIDDPISKLKEKIEEKKMSAEFAPIINKIEKSYNEMRDLMLTSGMAGLSLATAFHEIYRGIGDVTHLVESDSDKQQILDLLKRFSIMMDTFADFLKKEKSKEVSFSKILENNIALSKYRFEKHGIIYSCPVLTGEHTDYTVKVPKSLIASAINNVIDNAIYWLDKKWGDDEKKKYLYVGTSDEFERGPAIIIADNGPGWKDLSPEDIIKPFITTKPGGMGLGMYYTNNVMSAIGGELILLTNKNDIKLPKQATGAVVALVFKGEVN